MGAIDFPAQLRFRDIDSNGHVNNGAYFNFLESARVYVANTPIALEGSPRKDTLARCIGSSRANFVTDHHIEYLRPLKFRLEPVTVRIRVTRIGRSSFDYGYDVMESDGSLRYAVAHTGMVIVSLASGKGDPIDLHHRTLLESLMDEPPQFRRFTLQG